MFVLKLSRMLLIHILLQCNFWTQTVLIPLIHEIPKKLEAKITNKKLPIFTNYSNFICTMFYLNIFNPKNIKNSPVYKIAKTQKTKKGQKIAKQIIPIF